MRIGCLSFRLLPKTIIQELLHLVLNQCPYSNNMIRKHLLPEDGAVESNLIVEAADFILSMPIRK